MHDEPDRIDFPELSDEAVIAINNSREQIYAAFQNHYCAQMHRYYHDRPLDRDDNDAAPPLDNPPF